MKLQSGAFIANFVAFMISIWRVEGKEGDGHCPRVVMNNKVNRLVISPLC